jgi:hypothetical protein
MSKYPSAFIHTNGYRTVLEDPSLPVNEDMLDAIRNAQIQWLWQKKS